MLIARDYFSIEKIDARLFNIIKWKLKNGRKIF